MKKFIDTVPSGGAPIHGQELVSDVLSKEVWKAIEAIYNRLTPSKYDTLGVYNDGVVLAGGQMTYVGPTNIVDVAAGIAYFPVTGVVAEFPSVSSLDLNNILPVAYINLQTPTTQQEVYEDTATKDYTQTYTALVEASAGGIESINGLYNSLAAEDDWPTLQWCLDNVASQAKSDIGSTKVVKHIITAWDMQTNSTYEWAVTADAANNISKEKVVSMEAIIREDATTSRQQFKIDQWQTTAPSGDIQIIENDGDGGFTVRLTRATGELFDGTRFNSEAESRGYILIRYDNS